MLEPTAQPLHAEASSPQPLAISQLFAIAGVYPPRGGPVSGNCLAMIHTFAGDYPAFGEPYAFGQLMPLSQATALFTLLGTFYGGDGKSTFALPDLRGRTVIGGSPGESTDTTLAMTYMMPLLPGAYPLLGAVIPFAANFAPEDWSVADGSLLPIADYPDLFDLIGTTYGGDGQQTFALPNLTGRAAIGTSQGIAVGQVVPAEANGGVEGLGLTYLLSTKGVFPSQGGDGEFPEREQTMGEVVAYAGVAPPPGYMVAEGEMLPVPQNQALYAVLGNRYGGQPSLSFALPDLRGRMVIGTS